MEIHPPRGHAGENTIRVGGEGLDFEANGVGSTGVGIVVAGQRVGAGLCTTGKGCEGQGRQMARCASIGSYSAIGIQFKPFQAPISYEYKTYNSRLNAYEWLVIFISTR